MPVESMALKSATIKYAPGVPDAGAVLANDGVHHLLNVGVGQLSEPLTDKDGGVFGILPVLKFFPNMYND